MASAAAPSGKQFEISHGEQRATIVEVGGGIRTYEHGSRAVLEPYAAEQICDGAHGAVLMPWPNRLADGRYSFDGVEHQLALSEPAKRTAIHGLLRWTPWLARRHERERVVMEARLHPQPGYPFELEVTVDYRLDEQGLSVDSQALNCGASRCPFGAGQHPYLSPGGTGTIDECLLELPASVVITTDERGLPSGARPVEESELDFRSARRIGSIAIDSPFTELRRGRDGRACARLTAPDGVSVELWVDESYTVLELFTGDTLAAGRRRTGLAVEPMSCPPNGLASGDGLLTIEPGESVHLRWGVHLL